MDAQDGPSLQAPGEDVPASIPRQKKSTRSKIDDEALKRLRLPNSQYELSQDLLDKQVEMLERKYGGARARRAALVIQRAFRKYKIVRRFQDLAQASKVEKRLSRRMDPKDWIVYPTSADLGDMESVMPRRNRPCRSISLRERRCDDWTYRTQRNSASSEDSAISISTSPQPPESHTLPAPKKVPPQVPKRTSSISSRSPQEEDSSKVNNYAYTWRQRACMGHEYHYPRMYDHNAIIRGFHNISDIYTLTRYKVSEMHRKRQYRVGLNLFNKKPEKGILFLIHHAFVEGSPQGVAKFLLSRKGLSKQMIGEYLGNLQNSFNMAVLECFVRELDLSHMEVDVALRRFQTHFRMPGEAQKIERLVEVFSQRYIQCNPGVADHLHNPDTIFILAFAIIMLNTDLHTPSLKPEKRMKLDEFVRNLRGVDDGHDLDRNMLAGIYERVKKHEFRTGSDHVTQVFKVQQTLVGKKPTLALPHRRLVCYCRLYEVYDVHKKERPHQREIFLFNDVLLVTKIFSKKKHSVTYTFKQSIPLNGMGVSLFEAPHYPHGIRLSQRVDDKVIITFNARNEHDRTKFVDDLKESILEMDEMENLRIEAELEKQKLVNRSSLRSESHNRDSGVVDIETSPDPPSVIISTPPPSNNLKRSTLSNSLLDLHDASLLNKPSRRGSSGSLDSGMSVSFHSGSNTSQSDSNSVKAPFLATPPSRGSAK